MASAVADAGPARCERQNWSRAASTARRSLATVACSASGAATTSATEVRQVEAAVAVLDQQLDGSLRARELRVGGAQALHPFLEQLQRRLELDVVVLQLRDDLLQPRDVLLEGHSPSISRNAAATASGWPRWAPCATARTAPSRSSRWKGMPAAKCRTEARVSPSDERATA